MTACIRAEELGLDTVLVEKMSFMGGAISISGGNQVVMGSQMQKDLGVTDDSVESMVEDFMANGANLNVPELITLYAENVGETSDWLQEEGVTFDLEGGLHQLAEYSHNRELAYTGSGAGAAEAMRGLVAESGAKVLLNTRASELLTDENGAVTGVIAADDTTTYTINAGAVLLATGGYGYNKDLLTEEMQSALYYGPVYSTGNGVIMATAEGIDADTRLMEYGKRYPTGIEVSEGIAKSTINGNIPAWKMSAILVNAEGERVVNEKASNRTILETELQQTGSELYLVMDQETFDVWSEKVGYDVTDYLEANGTTTPVFAHGETIEEAAAAAGIDGEALAATVERYNGFVENGEDEDFGRSAEYMTMPIGDGPYYIIEQKPRFATTMGGLVINTDLQVMNKSGEVIEGLYAAGEVVGGVMGDDSPSGANNGWAVTSGKLSAESIAAALGAAEEDEAA
jgi:fumarate reductase flavoprotein subunit